MYITYTQTLTLIHIQFNILFGMCQLDVTHIMGVNYFMLNTQERDENTFFFLSQYSCALKNEIRVPLFFSLKVKAPQKGSLCRV